SRFVFDVESRRTAWADGKVLQGLGGKTHPHLLTILGDQSLRVKLVKPTGVDLLPEAPFNRVCFLLEESPPEAAVPLLSPFLNESSDGIRKDAAIVLGSIGTESVTAPVRLALRDSDEYVRSYALMGLGRAIEAGRLSGECRRDLFGDVRQLISAGKNGDEASRLLLKFDRNRATDFFFSDAQFSPKAESLHEILSALNEKRIIVPRARLLSLVASLGDKE